MNLDLNPIPWGAQDRFQAHFIVKTLHSISEENFLARPKLQTKGYFSTKRVVGVKWAGSNIADTLNSDNDLKTMMTKLSYEDAQIYVEPTKGGIRIHGKWKDGHNFTMTQQLFAVYDRIASHIKRELGSPPVQS